MEKKYITDTDFLPQELTHYHGAYSDEMTDGLYQIVYGILAPSQSLSNVYDVVIRVASREKSPAIRKFKLQSWKKSIDGILKTLNKVDTKGFEVIVLVPLRSCEMTLSALQSYFQLAIFTISELLESDTIPQSAFPNDVVPNIKQLFIGTYSKLFAALDKDNPLYEAFYQNEPEKEENNQGESEVEVHYQRFKFKQAVVLDEMFRRGIDSINSDEEEDSPDPILNLKHAVFGSIFPSQYYNKPELFKEIFIEKDLQLELNAGSPLPNASELPTVSDNDTIETRAKVMFAMMRTIQEITDDNFNRYVALIDFAVGKQPRKYHINTANDTEINKENNNNSIKKYVRYCRDNQDFLNEPTSDKVRARLLEQGFEIPVSNKAKTP